MGRRVMLVEDDVLIQEILQTHLAEAGCEVVSFSGAEEALQRIEEPFDFAVIDFHLSGINGLEFAQEAGARNPRLFGRFLFITGSVLPKPIGETLDRMGARLLAKPFTRAQLLEAMADVLTNVADGGGTPVGLESLTI